MAVYNLTEYWQRIKSLREELAAKHPDGVWLTMIDHPQAVTRAYAPIAARCIVDGTHRISTDAEVKQFQASMDAARDKINAQELSRKQQFVLNVPPEMAASLFQVGDRAAKPQKG